MRNFVYNFHCITKIKYNLAYMIFINIDSMEFLIVASCNGYNLFVDNEKKVVLESVSGLWL